MAQYEETDGAIALLGTSYHVNYQTILYTKSLLMSVPQAVTYDGYNIQPTEVVSVFLCSCVYMSSTIIILNNIFVLYRNTLIVMAMKSWVHPVTSYNI